jgi:hypothetical protein
MNIPVLLTTKNSWFENYATPQNPVLDSSADRGFA